MDDIRQTTGTSDAPRACLWRRILLLALVSTVASTQLGGLCDPGPGTCDDRFGCGDNSDAFEYLESCDVTGDLTVEVGHGEDAFTRFDDSAPEIHHGTQGGSHIFAAVRVGNVALDQYDVLRITLIGQTRVREDCVGSDRNVVTGLCGDTTGTRELVLGAAAPIELTTDGLVEEAGLLLRSSFGGSEAALSIAVEDPCRRMTVATERWTP